MTKKNLLRVTFALAACALIGGGIIAAQAASDTRDNSFRMKRAGNCLDASQFEAREARQAQGQLQQTAAIAALEAGDYSAWQEAVGDNNPFKDKITAENFNRLIEAHNLRMEADQIMTELGIDRAPGQGQHRGMNQDKGMQRMMR